MYKKNCKRCGNDFISRSAKARYCPECVPVIKLRSLKSKNKELNRACTDDTEFLVSIYTARGGVTKQDCIRPRSQRGECSRDFK